ncbi:MAG: cytochrome c oxidase subunit II [Asticcacaulis sp.]|nr:cytochrome c oxidase subunit II [Asticcacaulis sp.]
MATLALGGMLAVSAVAEELKVGEPTDKAMGWQPAASDFKVKVEDFYNNGLFPIITVISLFVLALLVWIVVRYNKKANPNPAKFSHNTLVEIIWTVVPVCILVFVAIWSISLLKFQNDMPPPDVVIKATGNQWYWTYDYPELGVTDVESRLLPAARDLKTSDGTQVKYLLSTDNVLVVPVNQVVQVQTTATDVIHSWTVPAFGIKMDAVPGRLNNTWFKANKTGTYYGQCSELCGQDHAYMPIEVKVVSQAEFDDYIVKAGGKTRAMLAADEQAAAQASAQTAAATAASEAAADSASAETASATPASAVAKPAAAPAPAAPASVAPAAQ